MVSSEWRNFLSYKKSRPWQTSHKLKSVKDGMENLIYLITRGATLLRDPFRDVRTLRALFGIPTYSRQLTYAHTSQNTGPCGF